MHSSLINPSIVQNRRETRGGNRGYERQVRVVQAERRHSSLARNGLQEQRRRPDRIHRISRHRKPKRHPNRR